MYLTTAWFIFRGAEVSDCGRYVLITPTEGCAPVNRLYYCDLHQLTDAGITGKCQLFLFIHLIS